MPSHKAPKTSRTAAGNGQISSAHRAKVFWTGRSQAVRLPKEFRFVGDDVKIYRVGNQVILEPDSIASDANGWPIAWWDLAGACPDFEVGDRQTNHERADIFRDE